jgi:hypothetical protein
MYMKSSAIYTPNAYEVICRVARMAELLRLSEHLVTDIRLHLVYLYK